MARRRGKAPGSRKAGSGRDGFALDGLESPAPSWKEIRRRAVHKLERGEPLSALERTRVAYELRMQEAEEENKTTMELRVEGVLALERAGVTHKAAVIVMSPSGEERDRETLSRNVRRERQRTRSVR